jgi:hypothetical protein
MRAGEDGAADVLGKRGFIEQSSVGDRPGAEEAGVRAFDVGDYDGEEAGAVGREVDAAIPLGAGDREQADELGVARGD